MEALRCNNFLLLGLFHFLLLLVCFHPAANAEFERFEQPVKQDGSMSFLVIGDWGRRGDYNQSEVAVQMGKIGEKLNIDFVVSTGDNFYDNGLVSDADPEFEESFIKIYSAPSLQKPWYSVLGNHDYRGNAEAQLSLYLRKLDSRWLCLRSFIVNSELVEIFFVDTTPFVRAYFTDAEGHTYDWRGVKSRRQYIRSILKDLDPALKNSTATWKIVVGHHAIRSISHHGDTPELVNMLLPILRANNVDFYMNGHDHCLQHIQDTDGGIRFLTSGAGSKAWRGDTRPRNENVNYFYDGQGFMSVELTPDNARIVFYDVFGEVLHEWTTSKKLYSAV